MSRTVDYYLAPPSPWSYLGHRRFTELARSAGAIVKVLPIDLAQVFPVSGGLPLAKRAPQRQAYRLVELRRFADHLGVPIHLEPAFFPVASDAASRLIIAVDQHDGADAAMALTGAVMSGVWAEQRNIADLAVLAAMLEALGLAAGRLDDSQAPSVQAAYEANTRRAIDVGVFGAPSYVIDGEMFWGQDRLDFVERRLAAS
ncbi:2-hydroxychromene-2-carboxylate isomerase [soil metagenome]